MVPGMDLQNKQSEEEKCSFRVWCQTELTKSIGFKTGTCIICRRPKSFKKWQLVFFSTMLEIVKRRGEGARFGMAGARFTDFSWYGDTAESLHHMPNSGS